jgi:bacterial/archaeal transporter family-2 protein
LEHRRVGKFPHPEYILRRSRNMHILFLILLGLAGGIAVGLQGPLTSLMSQRVGTLESIFVVHLGGALLAGIPLLFLGGGNLGAWQTVPWYALGAGALGLVILGAVSITIPQIGVATTVTLIVVAELVTGAALDHWGLFGATVRTLDWPRALGILVLLVGTWLIVR